MRDRIGDLIATICILVLCTVFWLNGFAAGRDSAPKTVIQVLAL